MTSPATNFVSLRIDIAKRDNRGTQADRVLLGKRKSPLSLVALKVFCLSDKKREEAENVKKDVKREMDAMTLLRKAGNSVLQALGTYDRDGKTYFVFELCACSLKELLEPESFFWIEARLSQYANKAKEHMMDPSLYSFNFSPSFESYFTILLDLCSTLARLASEKLIHRDIKPGNVLIDFKGQCRVGDFGTLRKLPILRSRMTSNVGTYWYTAPEVYSHDRQHAQYDESADVFSFGVTVLDVCAMAPWAIECSKDGGESEGSPEETLYAEYEKLYDAFSELSVPDKKQKCFETIQQGVALVRNHLGSESFFSMLSSTVCTFCQVDSKSRPSFQSAVALLKHSLRASSPRPVTAAEPMMDGGESNAAVVQQEGLSFPFHVQLPSSLETVQWLFSWKVVFSSGEDGISACIENEETLSALQAFLGQSIRVFPVKFP